MSILLFWGSTAAPNNTSELTAAAASTTASGAIAIVGTSATTAAGGRFSAAGTILISASASLAAAKSSSSGTGAQLISGTAALQSRSSLSGFGSELISGTAAVSASKPSVLSSDGIPPVAGTCSVTGAAAQSVSSGTVSSVAPVQSAGITVGSGRATRRPRNQNLSQGWMPPKIQIGGTAALFSVSSTIGALGYQRERISGASVALPTMALMTASGSVLNRIKGNAQSYGHAGVVEAWGYTAPENEDLKAAFLLDLI